MPATITDEPRWRLRRPDPDAVAALARARRISTVTASLLVARGVADAGAAEKHLEARLTDLHDPSALPDLPRACERILRAIESKETILVHGDYDVDGVTGTTILMRVLERLGARARWHIPDRFADGYSFGAHTLVKARETGATLVISVDNGTSAVETIGALADLGIDTIVTDHHEPPLGSLPRAVAIVNPKLESSRYPFRELCGGAVAFKLAWGLCQAASGASRVRADLRELLVECLGYVAIATVCDVVPLVDENRVLARHGLRALEMGRSPGVRALLAQTKLEGKHPLTAEDLAFKIGPRINAAGRLSNAREAVECLLAPDDATALRAAMLLEERNVERKRIELELTAAAMRAAEPFADRERYPVLVIAGQGWHQGVVGIVAARLVERFGRPALVIGLEGDSGRGSARSVAGFDVLEALHGGARSFQRYGGHAQAAGCEVLASDIDAVREAVCARAREMLAAKPAVVRDLWIDCEVSFPHVNADLMREIERLEPFGERNERPMLFASDLRLAATPRVLGADGTHLKLALRSGAHVLEGMCFGAARRASELAPATPIHVLFAPKWNDFRGERKLEIEIRDFRVGDRPAL